MKNWTTLFLIAATYSVVNTQSTSLCEDKHEADSACASYCYAVSKPLLQMAPMSHRKDLEISELKDKLQDLQTQMAATELHESQCKMFDELTAIRKAVESMMNSRPLLDFNNSSNASAELRNCKHELSKANLLSTSETTCRSSQRFRQMLTETRDELKKCRENNPNTQASKSEDKKAVASPEYSGNCLNVNTTSSIRKVKVEGIAPFRVPCNALIAGPGWMVIQQRLDNFINFEQNWVTYRRGFGDLEGSFFIGLEKLHRLTNAEPHELYISLKSFDGSSTQAHYDNFRVDSEAEGYRLLDLGNYTGEAGDAGDALSFNLNQKFSTFDRDNDSVATRNCAEQHHSGWWHRNCTQCNLNGLYLDRYASSQLGGIWWHPWRKLTSLRSVHMLIRPKH